MTNFLAFHKTGAEPFRCLVSKTEPGVTVVEPTRPVSTQLRRNTPPELREYRAEYVRKSGISDEAIVRFELANSIFSAVIDPTQTNTGHLIGGNTHFFLGMVTDNFNIHQLTNSY